MIIQKTYAQIQICFTLQKNFIEKNNYINELNSNITLSKEDEKLINTKIIDKQKIPKREAINELLELLA